MKKSTPAKKGDRNVYPRGFDLKRVRKVIEHYDRHQDDVLPLEKSGDRPRSFVWMEVPETLVPQIQRLIQRQKKPA